MVLKKIWPTLKANFNSETEKAMPTKVGEHACICHQPLLAPLYCNFYHQGHSHNAGRLIRF